jgi:uncharacterized protein (DUF58 family)
MEIGMNFFWHILYRVYRVVSWIFLRAPRRFTPTGLALLAALIIALPVGLDTENTVAYQGSTLLLFLLVAGMVWSWFFRFRFTATRLLPRFGTVGRPFTYRVCLRNLGAGAQTGLVLLEELADTRPLFREWKALQLADQKRLPSFRLDQRRVSRFHPATVKTSAVPPLPPDQDTDVRMELVPLRRGVLRFTGLAVGRADPLGLFRAFSRVEAPQTTLILPKRYPLPEITLPGFLKYQQGGVALASSVGQSEEFVALRDYRRGDPMRHIHWRSWARAGRPIVKEFEDEFFVRHALVLDTFADEPDNPVFEEAVAVAASFACTVETQESLLDLLFVGAQAFRFTFGRGLAHADQMLEILASVNVCVGQPFRALEHLALNHLATVSGCICVLLAWDEDRRKFVERIKALGMPVLVLIVRPAGGGKALEPGPMGDEPHRFHVLEMDRIAEGLARL